LSTIVPDILSRWHPVFATLAINIFHSMILTFVTTVVPWAFAANSDSLISHTLCGSFVGFAFVTFCLWGFVFQLLDHRSALILSARDTLDQSTAYLIATLPAGTPHLTPSNSTGAAGAAAAAAIQGSQTSQISATTTGTSTAGSVSGGANKSKAAAAGGQSTHSTHSVGGGKASITIPAITSNNLQNTGSCPPSPSSSKIPNSGRGANIGAVGRYVLELFLNEVGYSLPESPMLRVCLGACATLAVMQASMLIRLDSRKVGY
jgi:hypothetical protein